MTKTKITPITLEGILRVIGVKYIYPILYGLLLKQSHSVLSNHQLLVGRNHTYSNL